MWTSSNSEVVWHFSTIFEHLYKNSPRSTRLKYRWWDVYTCDMVPMVTGSTLHHAFSHLWHPTRAINRNAVRFFCSVLPSCNLCFCAGDTHFYSYLRVTSSDSRPKRQQSGPASSSQGSKCEHAGEGGSKYFRRIWTVQLLRDRAFYTTTPLMHKVYNEHVNCLIWDCHKGC